MGKRGRGGRERAGRRERGDGWGQVDWLAWESWEEDFTTLLHAVPARASVAGGAYAFFRVAVTDPSADSAPTHPLPPLSSLPLPFLPPTSPPPVLPCPFLTL